MTISIISFFTGAGFLDLGFEQAGFDIVWTNDVNPVFADIYEYGLTAWRRSEGKILPNARMSSREDITNLTAGQVLDEAFKREKPEVFGVIGGPPCPDFSLGGKHRGGSGKNGRLLQTFVEMIGEIQPAFFLIENVAGLSRVKAHRQFLDSVRTYIEQSGNGYVTSCRVLNSLSFGVPQDRERLFIVGVSKVLVDRVADRSLIDADDWFTWPEPLYENLKKLPWPKTSTFGSVPDCPPGIPEVLTVNSLFATDPPPTSLFNGKEGFKPHSTKFGTVPEGSTGPGKSFKRLHRYRYSPTAWYGNNEVHLHPWEPRRLTVREAMRIQSIPDSYRLPPDIALHHKFKVICNGVPCKLARIVAESLRAFVDLTQQNPAPMTCCLEDRPSLALSYGERRV